MTVSYSEYLAAIRSRFPSAFEHMAWLAHDLARQSEHVLHTRGRSRHLTPFTIEYLARPRTGASNRIGPADVLLYYHPARRDYLDLMVPVIRELRQQGVAVAVLVPEGADLSEEDFAGAPTTGLEAFWTPSAYLRARSRFRQLARRLPDFTTEIGLAAGLDRRFGQLLQGYCWYGELFSSALQLVRPRVILGIHFMSDPSPLGAVERHRASGAAVKVALLQHGVFSHTWATHDYWGADQVLLWSAAAERELSLFPGPKPLAQVIGNPRLDSLLRERPPDVASSRGGAARVLIIGTNGDPRSESRALQLAARAFRAAPGLEVVFRPHPSEPPERYEKLVSEGLVSVGQIQREGDLYEAVRDASLVVGTQSTALPESVLLGTPVIQIRSEQGNGPWPGGGFSIVHDEEELRGLALRLVSHPQARRAALEQAIPLARELLGDPRGAAQRAAAAIRANIT